jgi:hypothetical protein
MAQPSAKGGSRLDLIGLAVASVASLLLLCRALLHFDDSWDGTSYHLVLAAFRAHILTLQDLQPISNIVAAYNSYPPVFDIVRGYTWRMTGSILILQTFSLLAIGVLVAFWKWRYRLPMRWSLIAILTVPLLQIGAPTLYVDVFTNCFFAIAVSAMTASFAERRSLDRSEFVASLCGLAVAANSKPQFVVVGTVTLGLLCVYQLWMLQRQDVGRSELLCFLGPAALAWLLVPMTAIYNTVAFGNPVYPVSISIFGHPLPGLYPPGAAWKVPDYLNHVPQPIRWLASILEYRAFDGREVPYTIDQYHVIPVGVMESLDLPRPPSHRMGGYFAPLVLGLLAWLAYFARAGAPRDYWRLVVPLLVTSAIAFLPGSNELRYYSFWILNLILICFLAAQKTQVDTVPFRGFLLIAFFSVGLITGFRSFDPAPYSVQDHIHKFGMDRMVTGRDLCFENRNRDTILFTWIFHQKGRYRVVDVDPGQHCPSQ